MIYITALLLLSISSLCINVRASAEIAAPKNPVRLIFIHHSVGENWLSDTSGGLGIALRDNNYYVSDTDYDWGPDSIGSSTDIGNWWQWFRGPDSARYLGALYAEDKQISEYSRMSNPLVGGENQIIMFKSCFPNSELQGNINDPVPSIDSNPLRGESSGSEFHTVANAKGIYIDLLEYFKTRPDKLFVVITAPPLTDATYAGSARAFNNWLVDSWLKDYTLSNVFVFDFYNVLTTNGGNPDANDLGLETGNHHRWWNGKIQHKTDGDDDADPNTLEYPTGDDHPSAAGNQKATAEFVPLLNYAYARASLTPTTNPPTPTLEDQQTPFTPSPTSSTQEQGDVSLPLENIILVVAAVAIVLTVVSILLLRKRGRHFPPPSQLT
jgi:hypothetical protein